MATDKKNSKINAAMLASVWNMTGGILGCSLLGFLIGQKINQVVLVTLIGVFVGMLYCSLEVWKIVRKFKE